MQTLLKTVAEPVETAHVLSHPGEGIVMPNQPDCTIFILEERPVNGVEYRRSIPL